MSDAERQSPPVDRAAPSGPPDGAEGAASGPTRPPATHGPTTGAPAGGGDEEAEPEEPLRDLEEFTDADPEDADWPDGTEGEAGRPTAE